jgi:putative FmdB family regulatory protein
MPLYEWECLACDITFEDLAPVGEGRLERACPECGRMSPRVVSTFAIASRAAPEQPAADASARGAKQPPICLRYPHIPLLCHMDQPTAERAVAYAEGRGQQYEDKKGQREELRKKRGLPPDPAPAPPVHAHAHNPRRHQRVDDHGHPHTPGASHQHHERSKSAAPKAQKAGQPAPTAPSHNH